MLYDLETSAVGEDLSCDVCIVGAGAVGLATAVRLARKGMNVVVLEAGGVGLEQQSQALYRGDSVGHKFENIDVGRYRVLGGSTMFWGGQVLPFDPFVFDGRDWIEHSAWPLSRSDLDPYYDEAHELIGLGDAEFDDSVIWQKLGVKPDFHGKVRLMLSRWVRTRNFSRLFEKDIKSLETLKVIVHANVTGLEMAPDSSDIIGIRAASLNGKQLRVSAQTNILSCGAIETARLLLHPLADGKPAPWGENAWLGRGFADHLACTAGLVHRNDYKRFHELFDVVHLNGYKYYPRLVLDYKEQEAHKGVDVWAEFLFDTAFSRHLDNIKMFFRSLMDGQRPGGLLALPGHMISVARFSLPLVWRYLRSGRSYKPAQASVRLVLSCEQMPHLDSMIRLGRDQDALGMRAVEVDWQIKGDELRTLALFARHIHNELEARGLARVEIDPLLEAEDPAFLKEIRDDIHHMSTTRMGRSVEDGVVDKDLKVFGTSNLFVAGAAVFPTSGRTNPTLTGIALALRLCEQLEDQAA